MNLIILIAGVLISLVSGSGFGGNMNFPEKCTIVFGLATLWYLLNKNKNTFKLGKQGAIYTIGCLIILFSVLGSYSKFGQLVNFTTLYGIVIGTSLLSDIKWERTKFFYSGIILGVVAIFLIQLFLPGHILSGWNPNSVIVIVPAALCSLCLIYYSDHKYRKIAYLAVAFFILTSVVKLENRSSLITVFLLAALPIVTKDRILTEKNWLRIVCYGAILMNVGLPFFQSEVKNMEIYRDLQDVMAGFTSKSDTNFNGRDILWSTAVDMVGEHPFLGRVGVRDVYFHNFSCDVLTQFGWIGWLLFAFAYYAMVEKCYDSRNPQTNIFLLAFACLLVLNSFENVFLANGYFTIYPYLFFAIAWRLKNHPICRR